MPDKKDPASPDALASAWEAVRGIAEGREDAGVSMQEICMVMLDLRNRKLDRIP